MSYNRGDMFISHYDKLRRQKEARENRDLPVRLIARETGLSSATINKMKSSEVQGVTLASIGKLCEYFGVKSVAQLVEWQPDVREALAKAAESGEG